MLADMAILTGGQVISRGGRAQAREPQPSDAAGHRPARSSSPRTTPPSSRAAGPTSNDVEGRISQIKAEIDNTDFRLGSREAPGASGEAGRRCGLVQVGAATEVELKEKKHRIEDALSATRAAIEEGVVAGGGTALMRARGRAWPKVASKLEGDEATGAVIVLDVPSRPPLGSSPTTPGWRERSSSRRPRPRPKQGTVGLNAATGASSRTWSQGGASSIPAKVTRAALQNAASIAAHAAHHRGPRGRRPPEAGAAAMPVMRGHGRHGRHDVDHSLGRH